MRLGGGVAFLVGLVMYLVSFFIGGEPMEGNWYGRRGGAMLGVAQRVRHGE